MRLLGLGTGDTDQFTPDERDDRPRRQSAQSVDESLFSRWFVPQRVCRWGISVSITTPRTEYPLGTAVPFEVRMANELPFSVTLSTRSPILWNWTVDGLAEASHVEQYDPPDEAGKLHFGRGEHKRFTGRWPQRFRVSKREWEPATPGEYTLGAAVNVDDADGRLSDAVTIRLVSE